MSTALTSLLFTYLPVMKEKCTIIGEDIKHYKNFNQNSIS